MPIRREGDTRVEIHDWDTWIEKELRDARDRGEFDDLENAGKPLNLASTDVNKDWDLAFSRLKNAGVLPAWMELDRDCYRLRAELDTFLARSADYLQDRLAEIDNARAQPIADAATVQKGLMQRVANWFRFPTGSEPEERALTRDDVIAMREAIRLQYLERAAVLDKRIVEFNYALSRELSHLERMRMTPARAGRLFAAGCPPISSNEAA